MQNCMIRGVHPALAVRLAWCEAPDLLNAAIVAHNTDVAGAKVFADALLAASAAAVMLDDQEKFTFRFDYPGTVRGLIAECRADGAVRGLIQNPRLAECGAIDCDTVFGSQDGTLTVIRSENGKILNNGVARAPLASPSADLAFYFSTSDQVETEIRTFAVWQPEPSAPAAWAGALLLQAMPDCDLLLFERICKAMHHAEFESVVRSLAPDLPGEIKTRTLLAALAALSQVAELNSAKVRLAAGAAPHWHCSCSRSRMKAAMSVMGTEELRKLFAENPHPAIACNFCCKQYRFDVQDFFTDAEKGAEHENAGKGRR